MSETADLYWRKIPRAAAPYAQREDERESRLDRELLRAAAWLKRPFARGLRRADAVAASAEREQAAADGLTDGKLRAAADELRSALLRDGFAPDIVGRSFALVRAAAQRTVGLTHYPVQLLGGSVMLDGMLAEMETGEGKTLTATLPAATVALAGVPVLVVTVNDYLAERDAEWMRPVYGALGLTVGVARQGQQPAERRAAYAADICYCTNKDLGFDFLRDGLALGARCGRERLLLEKMLGRGDRAGRLLLRGLHFAIVDEADSVLVDEARTPLIISGAGDAAGDADLYRTALAIARELVPETDYRIDRQERSARLTDAGRERLRALCGALPGAWRSARGREELAEQALAALALYQRDAHYLVADGKVQIVDEYTGRVMPDRSWERGLHQLIEVKEECEVSGRRTTLARITYQRLFRRFLRLCGMTGTAREVAPELEAVYGLRVVRIPTNRPARRSDLGQRLYATAEHKWTAVAEAVARVSGAGRPALVGTRSVAASEELSARLASRGLEHVVLNARQDGDEAQIVARAGETGRITVATNMAGRGTDIRLGAEVAARGGLHVILTEFHESARIDRQLYGRCARQGDPGSFEAIVCLDDDIFRKHGGALARILAARHGGAPETLPGWAAAALQRVAQGSAEAANSRARQATLDLDRQFDQALSFAGRGE
jgi:preprotein translocase subunit SecA